MDFYFIAYGTQNVPLYPLPDSEIRYRTDGATPHRIFKAEWHRVGFEGAAGEISLQVWLFEGSDAIQVRMGPHAIPDPSQVYDLGLTGPTTVIFEDINLFTGAFAELQAVRGPATQPMDTVISNYPGFLAKLPALDGVPPTGLTYTFGSPISAASEPFATRSLAVFPNPARDHVQFDRPADGPARVRLIDALGRVAWQTELPDGAAALALPAALPSGHYTLLRETAGRVERAGIEVVR